MDRIEPRDLCACLVALDVDTARAVAGLVRAHLYVREARPAPDAREQEARDKLGALLELLDGFDRAAPL
jgi:uncharacterized membrane protein